MILNTKNRTISLENVDNTETKIIFKNIKKGNDIRYKLGINLLCKENSATLIDFDIEDDMNMLDVVDMHNLGEFVDALLDDDIVVVLGMPDLVVSNDYN